MKLNEKYDGYILDKAGEEVSKEFTLYSKKVLDKVRLNPEITKRNMRKLAKNTPLTYQSMENIIDTSLVISPIVNYVMQPKEIRKSQVSKEIRRQVNLLTRNLDADIKKPKQVIDKAYSIIVDGKKGKSSSLFQDFSSYLNSITPERESIIKEARKTLNNYTKKYKLNFTNNIYEEYKAGIDNGLSKQEAVLLSLNNREIKNINEVKRFLETEAHEIYENSKVKIAEKQGFKYKYWRTQRDSRVRHSHMIMDGKIVKNDEYFKFGKYKALVPGDSRLPIEERINCRCSIEFSFVPRGTRKGYNIPNPKPPIPFGFKIPKEFNMTREQMTGEMQKIDNYGNKFDGYAFYDKEGKEIVNFQNLDLNKVEYYKDGLWSYIQKDNFFSGIDAIPQKWIDLHIEKRRIENKFVKSYRGKPKVFSDFYFEWKKGKEEWQKNKKGFYPILSSYYEDNFKKIVEKQNFDKPPKIISKDELEKKDNVGLVVVRAYNSPKKETLDKYREDFENGDFYLDNTGGSVHGRGMYSAVAYDPGNNVVENEELKFKAENTLKWYSGKENPYVTGRADIMHLPKDFNYIPSKSLKTKAEEIMITTLELSEERYNSYKKFKSLNSLYNKLDEEKSEIYDNNVSFETEKEKYDRLDKISIEMVKIRREIEKGQEMFFEERRLKDSIMRIDNGILAASLGYDGIYIEEEDYMIILNRSKVELLEKNSRDYGEYMEQIDEMF